MTDRREAKRLRRRRRQAQRGKAASQPIEIVTVDAGAALQRVLAGQEDYRQAFRADLVEGLTATQRLEVVAEQAAWDQLTDLHERLLEASSSIVSRRSAAEWLWYTRRLASGFDGMNDLPSTAPYVRSLAEALGGLSAAEGPADRASEMLVYDVDEHAAHDFGRLAVAAGLFYDLHGDLRWAGKGAPVEFKPGHMPKAAPDVRLRSSVRDWDLRAGRGGDAFQAAGLYHGYSDAIPDEKTAPSTLLGFGRHPDSGRAGRMLLDFSRVGLLSDTRVPAELRWPVELIDLVLLHAAVTYSKSTHANVASGRSALTRWGYLYTDETHVEHELDFALAMLRSTALGDVLDVDRLPANGRDAYGRLARLVPSIWPPIPGALIRTVGAGRILVDMYGSTQRLMHAVARPPVVGADVNVWAEHFERDVQAAIDRSEWKPEDHVMQLRGRTLRVNGRDVTDIDAVGTRENVLLAVSCKSAPFSTAYDRGEFVAVRSTSTAAVKAAEDWAKKMELVRQTPRGDNFDVRAFHEIIGVVVYPFPPFITPRVRVKEAYPGLRAIAGIREFDDWCRAPGA